MLTYFKAVNQKSTFIKQLCATWVSSFSAIKSMTAIFRCEGTKNELSCIYGLRFYSMLLVVSGHVIMTAVRDYPWSKCITNWQTQSQHFN